MDLFNYHPRASHEVRIGNRPLGGNHPLRIQSMTTFPTTDTAGCVEQSARIIEAGGDYVRLTTQGTIEAENLRNIKAELVRRGFDNPLVADVHFNPKVADVAALYAEKVRINPGNYVDAARTFKHLEYTDEEYAQELKKIEERFVPFLRICRENRTAIRIGVNHGSLSDRIMSRYGDTPEGIVESCMEFLRICVKEDFKDVVVSIKASNTVVMVRSVRLLVDAMEREGMRFPLHLGVTEAGDGEDGRIKSAVGIGALLADGIGDTVRVSLSEAPEAEIPVARKLVNYVLRRDGAMMIPAAEAEDFDYLNPVRRKTRAVRNIGGDHVPVVIADRMDLAASGRLKGFKAHPDFRPDYIYCGRNLPPVEEREGDYIVDADVWTGESGTYPAFPYNMLPFMSQCTADLKFLFLSYGALNEEVRACLKYHPEVVVISQSNHQNRLGEHRALVHELTREGLQNPVVIFQQYAHGQEEKETTGLCFKWRCAMMRRYFSTGPCRSCTTRSGRCRMPFRHFKPRARRCLRSGRRTTGRISPCWTSVWRTQTESRWPSRSTAACRRAGSFSSPAIPATSWTPTRRSMSTMCSSRTWRRGCRSRCARR